MALNRFRGEGSKKLRPTVAVIRNGRGPPLPGCGDLGIPL
jgi:hypothetical protein